VRRRWRKWKHVGEDEPDNNIYDEDYEPEWMKGDEQGWAIGRRIYEKSEMEVNYLFGIKNLISFGIGVNNLLNSIIFFNLSHIYFFLFPYL